MASEEIIPLPIDVRIHDVERYSNASDVECPGDERLGQRCHASDV